MWIKLQDGTRVNTHTIERYRSLREGTVVYFTSGQVIVADTIEQIDKLINATMEQRDLTVARVDEHGVAYNAAGESIGLTGTQGPSGK